MSLLSSPPPTPHFSLFLPSTVRERRCRRNKAPPSLALLLSVVSGELLLLAYAVAHLYWSHPPSAPAIASKDSRRRPGRALRSAAVVRRAETSNRQSRVKKKKGAVLEAGNRAEEVKDKKRRRPWRKKRAKAEKRGERKKRAGRLSWLHLLLPVYMYYNVLI